MFDLTPADYSLLAWIQQSGLSAHSLSLCFYQGSLIVHCQTIEDAAQLWETRTLLKLPGIELCFRVKGKLYVASAAG